MKTVTNTALQASLRNPTAYSDLKSILEFVEGPGKRFYVHATKGSSSYEGSKDAPFASINTAIAACTANQGDVIFVMPGHVESLGSGETIDFDVAGITCIGLGHGVAKPRIDYDHANGAIDIGANSVWLENIQLRPSVTVVAIGIDVEAGVTDTMLKDIEFVPGEAGDGTDEFVIGIDIKAGCTRTQIHGLRYSHHASAGGPTHAVKLTGASDLVEIKRFSIHISGGAAVAGIGGISTLSTRMLIEDGDITSGGQPGIEMLTGTTGTIRDVHIFSNLGTIDASTVADGMSHDNVRYTEVGNEASTIVKTESADD